MTQPAWITSVRPDGEVSYPPAPWTMAGQMWVSVFRLRHPAPGRPAGTYGAAFVSYEEGSQLMYSELLVARLVDAGAYGRRVSITDIWVDSPASVAGGRELWAIPKDLCDFDLESTRRGPLTSTSWSASLARRPIASASFTDVSRVAPRVSLKGRTWQPAIADTGGQERTSLMQGTARTLPARGRWEFAADGPLAWMRDARQLASVRLADFRLSFG